MSTRSLRFYAIPPAFLLVVPICAFAVLLVFGRRTPRRERRRLLLHYFLPNLTLSFLSLLVGSLGLAAIQDAQLASIESVFLALLRLELAVLLISLVSEFNRPEIIPRTQMLVYNTILSVILFCATLFSFISTFLPHRLTPLLPPFLYLVFTILALPLLIYLLLASRTEPAPLPDERPPISPVTPTDFDTPPPSPSSAKRAFGFFHYDHSYPSIPRESEADTGPTIHIPIRFPSTRAHARAKRTDGIRDGSQHDLVCLLLVAQIASLLAFAFEICITVLIPDVQYDIPQRLHEEVQRDVWKTSITLRCFQSVFTLVACGCTLVVLQARLSRESKATRNSVVPPLTPHRPIHRRQASTTSSFCSPGLRMKSPILSPFPHSHPIRPPTPSTPTRKARSRSSQIFGGLRDSIHSYVQTEPRLPGRSQFPTLPIRLPRRFVSAPHRVHSPQTPSLDSFNMNDPFAPPSPGTLPRYNFPESHAGTTTRMSAWGTLTLPLPAPRNISPKSRRGGSNGAAAIVEEARLAEKLLERLDSESSSSETRST